MSKLGRNPFEKNAAPVTPEVEPVAPPKKKKRSSMPKKEPIENSIWIQIPAYTTLVAIKTFSVIQSFVSKKSESK